MKKCNQWSKYFIHDFNHTIHTSLIVFVFEVVKKIKKLTVVVTLVANSLYSGDDLFPSCGVKFCCILNSNVIFGSTGVEAVVVEDSVVPVNTGGSDVSFTEVDIKLPATGTLGLLGCSL